MQRFHETVDLILKKKYPVDISVGDITELSHFFVFTYDDARFVNLHFSLDGVVQSGAHAGWRIVQVVTTETMDWVQYLRLHAKLVNKQWLPCIDEAQFTFLLHVYHHLPFLRLEKLILQHNTDWAEHVISYTKRRLLPEVRRLYSPIVSKGNHFYMHSFSVGDNFKKLKTEIDRLMRNRDKYQTLHFHLDRNGGGDIVPAHMIIRCLVGKEAWMKPIVKVMKTKEVYGWDCWREELEDSPNFTTVRKLNLERIPSNGAKYKGKIYLHMDSENGSAAWFFITYLIYAFGEKVSRFSIPCLGQMVKYGKVQSSQLILLGHSGTTSGDGNTEKVEKKNFVAKVPTEQFISCSIKPNDWNRFWVEGV
jgi:hypothetical protein